MKQIKYILLLICSLTLVGCFGSNSVEHWIDNPTADEIKIAIDDNEIIIPAKSGVNYKFESGKHSLSYNNDSVNFTIDASKTSAIINPTLSNYVIYKIVFTKDSLIGAIGNSINSATGKKDDINYKTTVIINGESQEIEAPFTVINNLFINKDEYKWDYSLNEHIPDSIKARKFKSKTIKTKIFHEDDFFNYLKNTGVEDEISFPVNSKKLREFSEENN